MKISRNSMIAFSSVMLLAGCGAQNGATDVETDAGEQSSISEADIQSTVDLSAAPSGGYILDPNHGYITFSYNHQGYSNPFLRWGSWDAALSWDAENPDASSIAVSIDVSSIDSGVDRFDGHLQGEDFFDVANYPKISFVSTGLEPTDVNTGALTGDLTIKGQTHPVTLSVTINNAGEGRDKIGKLGFSARGTVKRSDFGIDKYVPFVSDEVDVIIEAEFGSASTEE